MTTMKLTMEFAPGATIAEHFNLPSSPLGGSRGCCGTCVVSTVALRAAWPRRAAQCQRQLRPAHEPQ